MKKIASLRRHSIAFVALMVALGGGAYAESKISGGEIRNNAIGPKKIKRNAVHPRHIRRGAVRASDVRGNSLGARKLRHVDTLESSGWVAVDTVDAPARLARSRKRNVVLRTSCLTMPGGTEARINVPAPPAGTVLAGEGVASTVFDGMTAGSFGEVTSPTAAQDSGQFSFISRGDVLQGTFHTAVNVQGVDCLFAVSVSG